ncbi:MAG TPA: aminotransferase class I/II-fold pyridoxal phosphate-dependent enzyme [Acidimicrobiales bacterium]|nr:aminotransferase class I/II-fold pyridoxal phosphate-dependent enzyme [Acidimicrobiales bacterium]
MTTPSDPTAPAPEPAPLHPDTRAVRSGRESCTPALAPVIWASSTFVSASVEEAQAAATSIGSDRFYSRYGNPTVADFERAVADLEGAEAARAFGSGMGAVTAVILGLCSAGDHIVAARQVYAGTQLVLQAVCPRFGIDVTLVDGTEPGALAAAVRPGKTVLVWAETPANPRLDLVDLDELGAIAGPMTVVDSTFATPLGQRPLDHGVDLVVHSATKALAGHNDATLGVVAASAELVQWLTGFAVLQGAVASPYDAANGLRGLRTLPVRFARQSASALDLARWLEDDGRAVEVRHPGLESHPQHALARRQMQHWGGLVCFDLPGGLAAGRRFVEAVEVAQLASSLGGPETLVTHPASTTHVNLLPDELAAVGIGPGTIRLSVGLEHVDDLRADLDRALAAASAGDAAG